MRFLQGAYLFLVIRSAPVLNKKTRQPAKRQTDRPAVTQSKDVKKPAVRYADGVCGLGLPSTAGGLGKMKSKVELVMTMTMIMLEKIQLDTNLVRKDLYASSVVLLVSSGGATYGDRALLTVASNWLSISACARSSSSTTVCLPSSDFSVFAEGSASDLSDPLVPQETSCQLLNA